MPPGANKSLPETGNDGEDGAEEDDASTTEPVVQRDGQPAAEKSTGKIWCAIRDALTLLVILNAELREEEQLCAVDDSFILSMSVLLIRGDTDEEEIWLKALTHALRLCQHLIQSQSE